MTDQKPMTTTDAAQPDAERQRRMDEATAAMKDEPALADRVRAAHPHLAETDDALKAALEDFNRLKEEQDKAKPE